MQLLFCIIHIDCETKTLHSGTLQWTINWDIQITNLNPYFFRKCAQLGSRHIRLDCYEFQNGLNSHWVYDNQIWYILKGKQTPNLSALSSSCAELNRKTRACIDLRYFSDKRSGFRFLPLKVCALWDVSRRNFHPGKFHNLDFAPKCQ